MDCIKEELAPPAESTENRKIYLLLDKEISRERAASLAV